MSVSFREGLLPHSQNTILAWESAQLPSTVASGVRGGVLPDQGNNNPLIYFSLARASRQLLRCLGEGLRAELCLAVQSFD